MTDTSDDLRTARELAPLHDLIHDTITRHRYVIGDTTDQLVVKLTVAVAAHVGAAVRGIPADLTELDTARRQLAAVREWAATWDLSHGAAESLNAILNTTSATKEG